MIPRGPGRSVAVVYRVLYNGNNFEMICVYANWFDLIYGLFITCVSYDILCINQMLSNRQCCYFIMTPVCGLCDTLINNEFTTLSTFVVYGHTKQEYVIHIFGIVPLITGVWCCITNA